MAKYIVRYLLEGNGDVPKFVEDGGYFVVNEEICGMSVDDLKRHLPATVHKLTKLELITRLKTHFKNIDGSDITDVQALNIIDTFLQEKGLSDYE